MKPWTLHLISERTSIEGPRVECLKSATRGKLICCKINKLRAAEHAKPRLNYASDLSARSNLSTFLGCLAKAVLSSRRFVVVTSQLSRINYRACSCDFLPGRECSWQHHRNSCASVGMTMPRTTRKIPTSGSRFCDAHDCDYFEYTFRWKEKWKLFTIFPTDETMNQQRHQAKLLERANQPFLGGNGS